MYKQPARKKIYDYGSIVFNKWISTETELPSIYMRLCISPLSDAEIDKFVFICHCLCLCSTLSFENNKTDKNHNSLLACALIRLNGKQNKAPNNDETKNQRGLSK